MNVFVTAVTKDGKQTRCWGYFKSVSPEIIASFNKAGLDECLYDYLVLEYMPEGLYPTAEWEEWYEFNTTTRVWDRLICKPEQFSNTINFGIG